MRKPAAITYADSLLIPLAEGNAARRANTLDRERRDFLTMTFVTAHKGPFHLIRLQHALIVLPVGLRKPDLKPPEIRP